MANARVTNCVRSEKLELELLLLRDLRVERVKEWRPIFKLLI